MLYQSLGQQTQYFYIIPLVIEQAYKKKYLIVCLFRLLCKHV